MKTYRVTSPKTWARLPKKLPGNWWKLLYAPPPKPKRLPFPPHVRVTRFTLDEFKKKLDVVLKPLGFSATKCEYDMRYYCIRVHMQHVFPKHREHVVEWPDTKYARITRDTPITIDDVAKMRVIEPEAWHCVFQIAEEEFAFEDHKYLLQHCCRCAVDNFTNFQLSKIGA